MTRPTSPTGPWRDPAEVRRLLAQAPTQPSSSRTLARRRWGPSFAGKRFLITGPECDARAWVQRLLERNEGHVRALDVVNMADPPGGIDDYDAVILVVPDDNADAAGFASIVCRVADGHAPVLAVAGTTVPAGALADPRIDGLIGMPVVAPELYRELGRVMRPLSLAAFVRAELEASQPGTAACQWTPGALVRDPDATPLFVPVDLPQELIADYHESMRQRQAELLVAIDARDTVAIAAASHRLAGSGAAFGYPRLTAVARLAEYAIDADAPWAEIQGHVDATLSVIAAVLAHG